MILLLKKLKEYIWLGEGEKGRGKREEGRGERGEGEGRREKGEGRGSGKVRGVERVTGERGEGSMIKYNVYFPFKYNQTSLECHQ